MDTLFANPKAVPLAEALRPQRLEAVLGQDHILAGPLGAQLQAGRLSSPIFWGPPGCGKTTWRVCLPIRWGIRFRLYRRYSQAFQTLKGFSGGPRNQGHGRAGAAVR